MEQSNPYFESEALIEKTKGNLPHWSQTAKLYFVTFRLKDSMPESVLEKLRTYCAWREQVVALHGYVPEEIAKYEIDKRNRMMEYLDAGHGECILKNSSVRTILRDCMEKMDGQNCRLHCYVIMPNRVHLILETDDDMKVSDLIGKLKSISAHLINRSLERKGSLWQYEVFDRLIRSAKHYWAAVRYISRNPRHCTEGSYTLVLTENQKDYLGLTP